jgi:hypothetical protein
VVTGLRMWVVYDSPFDIPGVFVARLWDGPRPTERTMVADDLVDLRHMIRRATPGLIRFLRMPDDDPKIVEVWL